MKKRNSTTIIRIVSMVVVISIVGYFGYKNFFGKTVITSNSDFFQLTVSSKYEFIENSLAGDEVDLGVYEPSDGLYLFGYAYQKQSDFDVAVAEDYQYYVEQGFDGLTDLENMTISGFDAYVTSYTYYDSYTDYDYYIQIYYIDGDDGTYILELETLATQQSKYKKVLRKIAESFKELN